MKIIITTLLALTLMSCGNNNNGTDGLTGTYATYWENEYHKVHDTLFIDKAGEGKDLFHIERHTGSITGIDGRVFPKKLEKKLYLADYDNQKKLLQLRHQEDDYVWDSENKTIHWGKTIYKKL